MEIEITPENRIIDIPDLNRFQIGDHVIIDASADNDRFEGVIIGIELRRVYGSYRLAPSITLLHDGYITDEFKPIDCRKVEPAPPRTNMAAADEDLEFARRYSSSSSYEDLARVLSHRLRQMDKRAKAANARADRLEAELRAASTSPESNVEPCQHKEWSTGYDHCQCKQCGSFRTDSGWGIASHTWFKSRTEAEFYQKNGRLPDPLPSSLKPGARS